MKEFQMKRFAFFIICLSAGLLHATTDFSEPIRVQHQLSQTPNMYGSLNYVPSQPIAPYPERLLEGAVYTVEGFVIEASDDKEAWREVAEGMTIASGTELEFDPVTARYIRFRVTDTTETFWAVYINEFQVFAPNK